MCMYEVYECFIVRMCMYVVECHRKESNEIPTEIIHSSRNTPKITTFPNRKLTGTYYVFLHWEIFVTSNKYP